MVWRRAIALRRTRAVALLDVPLEPVDDVALAVDLLLELQQACTQRCGGEVRVDACTIAGVVAATYRR